MSWRNPGAFRQLILGTGQFSLGDDPRKEPGPGLQLILVTALTVAVSIGCWVGPENWGGPDESYGVLNFCDPRSTAGDDPLRGALPATEGDLAGSRQTGLERRLSWIAVIVHREGEQVGRFASGGPFPRTSRAYTASGLTPPDPV